MPKGDKYSKLTDYLKNNDKDIIILDFDELEKIMGVKIPDSVFKYKTFGPNYNHSFSYGWSLADYIAKADFNANKVTFIKDSNLK